MNKPIRRWMVFLVCIAFAGQLLVGCSAKSQGVKTDRSDKKQLKIGFTIDTLVLERWTRDRDVFTAVAQELGAQVDVQNANNNLEKQKKHPKTEGGVSNEEELEIFITTYSNCICIDYGHILSVLPF